MPEHGFLHLPVWALSWTIAIMQGPMVTAVVNELLTTTKNRVHSQFISSLKWAQFFSKCSPEICLVHQA